MTGPASCRAHGGPYKQSLIWNSFIVFLLILFIFSISAESITHHEMNEMHSMQNGGKNAEDLDPKAVGDRNTLQQLKAL